MPSNTLVATGIPINQSEAQSTESCQRRKNVLTAKDVLKFSS